MKTMNLVADWDPKPEFQLGSKDIEGKLTYLGSKVWRNPRMEMIEKEISTPGPEEVLIEVQACGICGSDVHWNSRGIPIRKVKNRDRLRFMVIMNYFSGNQ